MWNKKTFGHLAALLTIVIWGTTFISTKILLVDFKPVEILFFRFVMGFVILLTISLLCDMEFCSKRVGCSKDKCLYLYGSGDNGHYFRNNFA